MNERSRNIDAELAVQAVEEAHWHPIPELASSVLLAWLGDVIVAEENRLFNDDRLFTPKTRAELDLVEDHFHRWSALVALAEEGREQ